MDVSGWLHAYNFTTGERALGTHFIGGYMGPRASLDAVVKRKSPFSTPDSNLTLVI